MIKLFTIAILFILIHCVSCNNEGVYKKIICFIIFACCSVLVLCQTREDTNITGGLDINIRNPAHLEHITKRYSELHTMIKRQFRIIGEKYTTGEKFLDKMMKIYKFKAKNKKWGNITHRPDISSKFNDKILNRLNMLHKDSTVVDYGCGDGHMLDYFKYYPIKNTICVDVDDYRTYARDSRFIKNNTRMVLDTELKNNSIDLVMALQSLHHIEFDGDGMEFIHRLKFTINNIIKKIKPGGYLLIREHDVRRDDDLYPVLFEHLLYEMIELENKSMIYSELNKWINNYHFVHKGWYFSKHFMNQVIEKNGMVLLETEYKKGINPSRIYNSLYIKK